MPRVQPRFLRNFHWFSIKLRHNAKQPPISFFPFVTPSPEHTLYTGEFIVTRMSRDVDDKRAIENQSRFDDQTNLYRALGLMFKDNRITYRVLNVGGAIVHKNILHVFNVFPRDFPYLSSLPPHSFPSSPSLRQVRSFFFSFLFLFFS